jgi:hypothetical protein
MGRNVDLEYDRRYNSMSPIDVILGLAAVGLLVFTIHMGVVCYAAY